MSRAEHRAQAEALARAAGTFSGGDRDTVRDVQMQRINLTLQGLLHAVLALVPDPEPAKPAPADLVLYRDGEHDLWTVRPDGTPVYLIGSTGTEWSTSHDCRYLSEVEQKYGPLHVVPWPGEVR